MISSASPQGEAEGDVPSWRGVNRITEHLNGNTAREIEQTAREGLIERQNRVIRPILVGVLAKMKMCVGGMLTLEALQLSSIEDLLSLVRHLLWIDGIAIDRSNAGVIEAVTRRLISQLLTQGRPRVDALASQNYIG